jgi:hypothetical protein
MECFISVAQCRNPRVVRITGRLSETQVPDLLHVYSTNAEPMNIDLGELMSADAVALEALHQLMTAGVRIVNAPRFIEFALDAMSRCD